jgi:hypothetical protein
MTARKSSSSATSPAAMDDCENATQTATIPTMKTPSVFDESNIIASQSLRAAVNSLPVGASLLTNEELNPAPHS